MLRSKRYLSEPDSFRTFYEDNYESLLRHFARQVYDPQLAMDLCAETFARAFAARRRFRGQDERAARSWLQAIAGSLLTDYFRRGYAERRALERLGIELEPAEAAELSRVEEMADLAGARRAIQRALLSLTPDAQLALRLRVIDERPYVEVAAALGISEQTARARVSRALRALSQSVQAPEAIGETP